MVVAQGVAARTSSSRGHPSSGPLVALLNAGGLWDLQLAVGELFIPLVVFLVNVASIYVTQEVSIAIVSAAPEK